MTYGADAFCLRALESQRFGHQTSPDVCGKVRLRPLWTLSKLCQKMFAMQHLYRCFQRIGPQVSRSVLIEGPPLLLFCATLKHQVSLGPSDLVGALGAAQTD